MPTMTTAATRQQLFHLARPLAHIVQGSNFPLGYPSLRSNEVYPGRSICRSSDRMRSTREYAWLWFRSNSDLFMKWFQNGRFAVLVFGPKLASYERSGRIFSDQSSSFSGAHLFCKKNSNSQFKNKCKYVSTQKSWFVPTAGLGGLGG